MQPVLLSIVSPYGGRDREEVIRKSLLRASLCRTPIAGCMVVSGFLWEITPPNLYNVHRNYCATSRSTCSLAICGG